MKFKEIIKKHTFKEVKKKLLQLYPDSKKSIEGYEKVFAILQKKRSRKSDVEISIEVFREDEKDFPAEEYIRVSEVRKRDRESYAIEYTPWSEWLGMEIENQTYSHFIDVDIIAHCLWEMTWSGFKEIQIQKQIKEFEKIGKEIAKDAKK